MATPKKPVEEVVETEYDPYEMVDIRIPRGSEKDDPMEFVSVNGRNFLIPKGKKCQVPRYIADEWNRSQRAKEAYYEKMEELQSRGQ